MHDFCYNANHFNLAGKKTTKIKQTYRFIPKTYYCIMKNCYVDVEMPERSGCHFVSHSIEKHCGDDVYLIMNAWAGFIHLHERLNMSFPHLPSSRTTPTGNNCNE